MLLYSLSFKTVFSEDCVVVNVVSVSLVDDKETDVTKCTVLEEGSSRAMEWLLVLFAVVVVVDGSGVVVVVVGTGVVVVVVGTGAVVVVVGTGVVVVVVGSGVVVVVVGSGVVVVVVGSGVVVVVVGS